MRATRSGDAGPYRDAPSSYGYRTEVAKDGTFRPYTILTATLKEGESAPVVPPQKHGPKKGFVSGVRACGCKGQGPHKSSCHLSSVTSRTCGCAATGPHKSSCKLSGGERAARTCGCAATGPHKSSCQLSSKAKRVRGGPGAGPIPGV